ncbi:hypothetical protein GQ457_08G036000 [Hibiscus cannabinus]
METFFFVFHNSNYSGKLVLSTLPVYYMGLFVMPKGVIHRIDKIQRAFLWGGVELNRKMARVSWMWYVGLAV